MRLLTKSTATLLAAVGLSAALGAFALLQPAIAQDSSSSAAASSAPADTSASSSEATTAADPLAGADIARGKKVYATVGICTNCHGWDGNGLGKNPRSEGLAALLRDTQLDAESMIQVVSCGIPGTAMPYHDQQAYKDDRCYGMKAADFQPGQMPQKGNTLRQQDIVNVVAYIFSAYKGKGKTTYDDCVAWFEASAEKSCGFLKGK